MTPDIAVVGSLNHDLTVHTPRHPKPGETVLGTSHYSSGGGKGANQAVAAARLGSAVAMIGAVGDDEHGQALLAALASDGIDLSGVGIRPTAPTGLAVITIDSDAENTIVVSPGANLTLTPADIASHADVISGARVLLAQLEVPVETVMAAAELVTETFCLNPAPAQTLPRELLNRVDVLIPNRSELADLAGVDEPSTEDQVMAAVARLEFAGAVVVTLGADGALIVEDGIATTVPAPRVEAVDPTGAGDAFCGALAHGLARGSDLETSTRRAVVAGAIASTRNGAQPSMPAAEQLEALLEN